MIPTSNRRFLRDSIAAGYRLDGRPVDARRRLEVTFGSRLGVAAVRLGDAVVHVAVFAEMGAPHPDKPQEGTLSVAVESVQGSLEEIERVLERTVREAQTVDLESLCLHMGTHVWNITVKLVIVSEGGNIHDCCHAAAMVGLLHVHLPKATFMGSTVVVHTMSESEPIPLQLTRLPISVTFIAAGDQVLVDPSAEEGAIAEGQLSVVMAVHPDEERNPTQVCGIYKPGGTPLSVSRMLQCINTATHIATDTTHRLHQLVQDDLQRRRDLLLEYRGAPLPPHPLIVPTA